MSAFANRIALITGAGSGLGRALALRLAAEGAIVAAVDVNADALTSLEQDLAGKPMASAVADVTDRDALRDAVVRFEKRLAPIELLIANAGIGIETTAENFRAADVEAQIRVNLLGVANSIEAVLPGMIQRRRGHLVGISSLASYRGLPRMAGYCASKAGLNALLEGLRFELRPLGIAVTTVCPGWIRTPLTDKIAVPKPHILEPADAARTIVQAIGRRRSFVAFPPPAVRRIRFLKWLPGDLSDWLMTRILRSLQAKS